GKGGGGSGRRGAEPWGADMRGPAEKPPPPPPPPPPPWGIEKPPRPPPPPPPPCFCAFAPVTAVERRKIIAMAVAIGRMDFDLHVPPHPLHACPTTQLRPPSPALPLPPT